MSPFLRPGRDDAKARETLDRAVGILRGYERAGAREVPVADVLELLGAAPQDPVPQARARDPLADPMTGARWAGAPGSSPPGS